RNGLRNTRGTIAAARTADPHSATAQFYINTVDNPYLDASASDWGYTVFGEVTEGMDVVDAISHLATGPGGPFPADVPSPLITILSVAVLDRAALAEVDGPDLQAALLARIDAAEETNSPAQALQWISQYRASCAPAGPDLLVTEARHAAAVGANDRARFALEEFFATAPDSHGDYGEAQVLYEQLTPGGSQDAAEDLGSCVAPEAPEIPDGTRESLDGMLAAQSGVQAFMGAGTSYLECLEEIIDDEETAQGLRTRALNEYNRMVDLTQQVGDDFNRQVRAFRARQ
ncbi:MAG: peptidylprolyl isomerase, partial [Gammaproteobacteria bacterium]